jgi:hypothetical protein
MSNVYVTIGKMPLTVAEYVREDGAKPYQAWFDDLPAQAAAKASTARARLEMGNTSAVKWIGVIGEYRIDLGARLSNLSCERRRGSRDLTRRRHKAATTSRHRTSEDSLGGIQNAEGGFEIEAEVKIWL